MANKHEYISFHFIFLRSCVGPEALCFSVVRPHVRAYVHTQAEAFPDGLPISTAVVRSRVYETVERPSVCRSVRLSVPSTDCGVQRVCCWAPRRQEISIDSVRRRSAANAGSVMLTAGQRGRLSTADLLTAGLSGCGHIVRVRYCFVRIMVIIFTYHPRTEREMHKLNSVK